MTEDEQNQELQARKETLKKIGDGVERAIASNEQEYLSVEDAREIRRSVPADWDVFSKGKKWEVDGDVVEVTPENAMTGSVLDGRSLLVLAALGEETMKDSLIAGLSEALKAVGGGVNKRSEKPLSDKEIIGYAGEFIDQSCFVKHFRYGKDDGEVQKIILNRLEAMVNVLYYELATAALEKDSIREFRQVQSDFLLSANVRLPILKGIERSLPQEKRHSVKGFAEAAPIRHVSPGCLGKMTEAMVK